MYLIADKLEEVKDVDFSVEEDENIGVNRVLYKHTPSQDAFTITRDDDGAYVVSGNAIERMFKMTDFKVILPFVDSQDKCVQWVLMMR